ncbi:toxin YeeV [Escherichia coli UMEA 3609-1]|jgi:cytoskeleton-binding toxin CbtA-like protein|nr:toxin YeeV [Escherichia coli UMEA 3592-1]EQZ34406.1 toxin YeeV [Escherichia coli UMEA 3609-1]STP70486.1 toxin of the YeeV-YeeU toxin-antitoxin system [Escherichia coli]HAM4385660.1 hypothetical protein [Escherichia coli]
MKTLPDTHVREASRCPSPVTIWQILLSRLLDQHYGLTLNDTPFADERVIEQWICPYISRHLLSLNPLQARCRRYSRGER